MDAGKVPVKWIRSNELRHNPVLEGLNMAAGFAPAGAYVRLEGPKAKILEKLDPALSNGLKSLFPEVFS